jgi:UDP-glucuronate 4-epimerase
LKLLVTGGAGFIGSHLTGRRLSRGDRVVVFDDFNDFYDPALKRANVAPFLTSPGFRLIEGDIRDRNLIFQTFAEEGAFDAVLHFAARAGVRPSLSQPVLYEEVNCVATLHLLDAAVAYGRPLLLFASSSSVYGINSKLPFSEEDPIERPISPYATTKRAGELHVFAAHHLHRLPAWCLRFFTVYGPRQRPEMAIARFIRSVEEGVPIPVYGDGTARRDYTYIDDIADGVEAALDSGAPASGFEIVNLGGARPVTLSELVSEVEKATGRKARLDRQPLQPGDVPVTYASVEKAERLLGFRARVPLPEGLRRSVEWFRSSRQSAAGPARRPAKAAAERTRN